METVDLESWFRQFREQGLLEIVLYVIKERRQARETELRALLVNGNVCHDRDQEAEFYRLQGRTDELGALITTLVRLARPPSSGDPDQA